MVEKDNNDKDPSLGKSPEVETVMSYPKIDPDIEQFQNMPLVGLEDDLPAGFVEGLPPLPKKAKEKPVPPMQQKPPMTSSNQNPIPSNPSAVINRATGRALIFSSIVFGAFAIGITAAVLLLSGTVDAQILWLKGIIKMFKG